MKLGAKVCLLVVACAAIAGCGGSGKDQAALTMSKFCGKQQPLNVSARKILRVSGKTCVVADKESIVIARGDSVVAAHGHSTVDAGGNVTVVVYSDDVTCNIRGYNVAVIDRVPIDLGSNGMDYSCFAAGG